MRLQVTARSAPGLLQFLPLCCFRLALLPDPGQFTGLFVELQRSLLPLAVERLFRLLPGSQERLQFIACLEHFRHVFLDPVRRLFAGLKQFFRRTPPRGVFRLQLLIEPEQLGAVFLQSRGQFLARRGELLPGSLVPGDLVFEFLGGLGQLCLDSLAVGGLRLQLLRQLGNLRRPFLIEFFLFRPRVLERFLSLFSFGCLRLQRLPGPVHFTGQLTHLRFKLFSRVRQVGFQGCALGQVGHQPERTFQLPLRRADRSGAKERQAFGAVLAAKAQFAPDRLAFLLSGEHPLHFALSWFGHKIDNRAMNQLLDRVSQHLSHLRVDVLGVKPGIEQPGPFLSVLDQTVESFMAVTQGSLEFLALEKFLHLSFCNAQPHIQRADVVRLDQKIIGARGENFAQVGRLAQRSRDHDECSFPLRLGPHPFAELQPIHAREAHIHEEQGEKLLLVRQDGLFGVFVSHHLVSAFRQHLSQQALAH